MDNQTPELKPRLEKMADFFTARIDRYEAHMCKDGYDIGFKIIAELVPPHTRKLLDLGCGTGLELDEIFKLLPRISVTGIDLAQAMLDKLKQKHPDKDMVLICGDYLRTDLGESVYDVTISCNTLHHFTHGQKLDLYRNILKALKPGGIYVEGDYMVDDQSEEDKLFAESIRVRREQNIPDGEIYHFDTPCTVQNQIALLRQAGFKNVEFKFRFGMDALISGVK